MLKKLGVRQVFGVPGGQNVPFFEALRRSDLKTVLTTHEAGAGFMANGYYRASGKLATLVTISGPGFTNAITALAEAREDSAALLYFVTAPSEGKQKFRLHALNQVSIIGSIVKQAFTIHKAEDAAAVVSEAFSLATTGEPGPVMVQVTENAMVGCVRDAKGAIERMPGPPAASKPNPQLIETVITQLQQSAGLVIYAGMGCQGAAEQLREFAELTGAPVIMTRSGRGILPMDHPLALTFEANETGADACNQILAAADLILVLGCKLSHNGTAGFRLHFPPDRTLHVDTSREVLGANYPVRVAICQDVAHFLSLVLNRRDAFANGHDRLRPQKLELLRGGTAQVTDVEPRLPTVPGEDAKWLFDTMRAALSRDTIVVTDSGLHQGLTFRYWQSYTPAGIVAPTDFQSMGFGIPAAIGAKLACPHREVVAIVGDGGFAMSAMELLTAIREKLGLTVFVFTDGALGQIRLQQLASYGASYATTLTNPDVATFARAIGADYARANADLGAVLDLRPKSGLLIIEVPVRDSRGIQLLRGKGLMRRIGADTIGSAALSRLKSTLKFSK